MRKLVTVLVICALLAITLPSGARAYNHHTIDELREIIQIGDRLAVPVYVGEQIERNAVTYSMDITYSGQDGMESYKMPVIPLRTSGWNEHSWTTYWNKLWDHGNKKGHPAYWNSQPKGVLVSVTEEGKYYIPLLKDGEVPDRATATHVIRAEMTEDHIITLLPCLAQKQIETQDVRLPLINYPAGLGRCSPVVDLSDGELVVPLIQHEWDIEYDAEIDFQCGSL